MLLPEVSFQGGMQTRLERLAESEPTVTDSSGNTTHDSNINQFFLNTLHRAVHSGGQGGGGGSCLHQENFFFF